LCWQRFGILGPLIAGAGVVLGLAIGFGGQAGTGHFYRVDFIQLENASPVMWSPPAYYRDGGDTDYPFAGYP